jgi:hypothetical protein
MKEIILVIVTLLINALWNIYVKPHLADKKKINSVIKKVFFFILTYILPIFLLVYAFIFLELNKFFVVYTVIIVAMLLFRFLTELHFSLVKKFQEHKIQNFKNEGLLLKLIKLNFEKDVENIKTENLKKLIIELEEKIKE